MVFLPHSHVIKTKKRISPLDMTHVPYLPHLPTLTFFGKLIELGVLCVPGRYLLKPSVYVIYLTLPEFQIRPANVTSWTQTTMYPENIFWNDFRNTAIPSTLEEVTPPPRAVGPTWVSRSKSVSPCMLLGSIPERNLQVSRIWACFAVLEKPTRPGRGYATDLRQQSPTSPEVRTCYSYYVPGTSMPRFRRHFPKQEC